MQGRVRARRAGLGHATPKEKKRRKSTDTRSVRGTAGQIAELSKRQMKRKGAPMSRTTSAAGFIVIEGLFVGGLVGGLVGGFGGGGFEGVFGGGGDIGGGEDDHGGAQAAEL